MLFRLTIIYSVALITFQAADDASKDGSTAGKLTCTVEAPAPELKQLACTFAPSAKESAVEYYAGTAPAAETSPAEKTIVVWSVRSPSPVGPGGLEGTYTSKSETGQLVGRNAVLDPLSGTDHSAGTSKAIRQLTLSRSPPRVSL